MQNNNQLKKLKLQIHGMHCASCEVLIERNFKKIQGVEKVNVNQFDGKAKVYCFRVPNLQEFQAAVKANGYSVSPWHSQTNMNNSYQNQTEKPNYAEIATIFVIVLFVLYILSDSHLIPQLGITNNMSYGFVFLIGLVAALSTCIAVTGGLLLAIAAKYNEQNPDLSGWQKFKPSIYFNVGRIISYTILGGAIGALGSVLTLSPRINGVLTLAASGVMLILGLQMLKLFPWLSRFQPKMPKFLAHRIHDMSSGESKTGPFVLGAATFFLPCGFTQALQLYVLSKGSWQVGVLTMLAFSLGTLPALLSLSAISSFAKGAFQSYFLKFAGVVVVLLGIFNIQNGLNLTGFNIKSLAFGGSSVQATTDSNITVENGKQIAKMKVTGLSYTPYHFTVKQGVPVEWQIDGAAAGGCAQVIMVPSLGITKYLAKDSLTTVEFTPNQAGEISFSCPMGMTTPGSGFTVIGNSQGSTGNIQGNTITFTPNSTGTLAMTCSMRGRMGEITVEGT